MKKPGLIVMTVLWLALGVFVTMVNTAAEHQAAAGGHGEVSATAEKSGGH